MALHLENKRGSPGSHNLPTLNEDPELGFNRLTESQREDARATFQNIRERLDPFRDAPREGGIPTSPRVSRRVGRLQFGLPSEQTNPRARQIAREVRSIDFFEAQEQPSAPTLSDRDQIIDRLPFEPGAADESLIDTFLQKEQENRDDVTDQIASLERSIAQARSQSRGIGNQISRGRVVSANLQRRAKRMEREAGATLGGFTLRSPEVASFKLRESQRLFSQANQLEAQLMESKGGVQSMRGQEQSLLDQIESLEQRTKGRGSILPDVVARKVTAAREERNRNIESKRLQDQRRQQQIEGGNRSFNDLVGENLASDFATGGLLGVGVGQAKRSKPTQVQVDDEGRRVLNDENAVRRLIRQRFPGLTKSQEDQMVENSRI